VREFQNPFRGVEGTAKAGIEETRPEGNSPAQQRQAQKILDRDANKQNGNCGEALPIKPSAASANKLATTTGAAICRPATNMPPENSKERVHCRPGKRKVAGRQILEAAPESTQQPVWDAELKKEQEHDQFVESGKYSGIGLTVVRDS